MYMYVSASAFEGKSEEEIEMMKIMGFGGFETTKVCTPASPTLPVKNYIMVDFMHFPIRYHTKVTNM